MQVRVNRDGKAKVGRRTVTFPLSLAGATITIPDPQPDPEPEADPEPDEVPVEE
jgi:hypothetical protein